MSARTGAAAALVGVGVLLTGAGAVLVVHPGGGLPAPVGVVAATVQAPAGAAGAPVPAGRVGDAGAAMPTARPVDVVQTEPVHLQVGGAPGAAVVPVGVAETGSVLVPPDPQTVGWWSAGGMPGSPGSTVLVGHVDAAHRGVGTLAALWRVHLGQTVRVTGADGGVRTYRVAARRSYPKAQLPRSLFAVDGPQQLVLVTCGGRFDARTGHYADNVVVWAQPA